MLMGICSLSAPAQLMEEKGNQIRNLLFPLTPFCPVLTPQQSRSAFAILYFLQSGSPRLLPGSLSPSPSVSGSTVLLLTAVAFPEGNA